MDKELPPLESAAGKAVSEQASREIESLYRLPVQGEAQLLRGSIGRVLNNLKRMRDDTTRKPIEEMGGIDLIFEAVRENNPRTFNRKVMKDMRKKFWHLRKMESSMRRTHDRLER
ncbi:MAG TPA: hypothetical protein VMU25_03915 [Candidatus Paceibacterota bacterium]|nr:hypothetical protein [Candidatus Paceibacterota bacterium]